MDPIRRRAATGITIEPSSGERPARAPPHGAPSDGRRHAEPRAERSHYGTGYERIREILLRYLSPILVDSVLDRALHARHPSPAFLGETALAEITADIMVGLRLFVPEERLSELMLELAETLDQGVR
jgi:hypothetical protein